MTRKINKGTLRTRGSQIIAYADDVVVITKRREITHKLVQEIIKEGEVVGLKINEAKTKLMRVGKKDQKNKSIKIENYTFEEVDKFKYLGVIISNDGNRDAEIKEKIMAASRAFYANKKLLKSKKFDQKDQSEYI